MDKISIINSTNFIINEIYKESHYQLSIDILESLFKHNILDSESIKYIEIIDNNEMHTILNKDYTNIKLHTQYKNDRIKVNMIVDTPNISYDYIGYIGSKYTGREGILDKVIEKLIKAKDKI